MIALLFVALAADVAPPPQLEGVSVTEHPGARIPLDLEFGDANDRAVRLGDLFGDGKPVVLTLAYYRCPMLCGVVLRAAAESMGALDWRLGRDYRAVTVSIDPRDGWQEAGRRQAAAPPGWTFLTDRDGHARALADALGFGYRWDEGTQQFAHPAVLFVLMPDGRIARTLYGTDFPPNQLKLALLDATQGRSGSVIDRVLMACFRWDPSARRYGVFIVGFLRLGAAVVLATLAALLVYLFRLERRRRAMP